ncbi:MAG: hypothetical protein QX189_03775 [Methylococcales bacterium]
MTTLTVHNIDDAIKEQLEINAIQHNCSVDEEVCRILKQALFATEQPKKLGSYLHQHIIELTGGVELELPARSLPRATPDFSEKSL